MTTPPPAGLVPSRPVSDAHRVALTRWSVVALAASHDSTPAREQARGIICQEYWYPLYVYLRRKGHPKEKAEDYVQGFFVEVFEKNYLATADEAKGKFRTFLLTTLIRYVGHRERESNAIKRGGGMTLLPMSSLDAEHRYGRFPAAASAPEADFDRAWAITLLERAIGQLKATYVDKPGYFETLRPYLTQDATELPYAETAEKLGISPLNTKVVVHRFRNQFRRILDQELRWTLDDDSDIEEERLALIAALSQIV